MAQTQIADVIVPAQFTEYQVENSLVSTALFESGVAVKNGLMASQLGAGAQTFSIPFWSDLADVEANISSDDPTVNSIPQKITASRQIVRKSFLNQSWSDMNLAGELAGSDPMARIQDRVSAYWNRQFEFRLFSSLMGVMYANIANNGSDMVTNIAAASPGAATAGNKFSSTAVIAATLTLGDRMSDFKGIAMHSAIYAQALADDVIQFFKPSEDSPDIPTYRGMAVIVDDNLTPAEGVYTSILFGSSAVGFAIAPPETGYGTEIFRYPSSGNGGGQTALFSRFNIAIHPAGFAWNDGTGANAVTGISPTIADLKNPTHWTRVVAQRKSVPLAFLLTN